MKTIRNLNLDHPGGIDLLISLISPPDGQDSAFPPRMVKIQVPDGFDPVLPPHFPPGWSRFGSNLLKMLASIFEADGYPLDNIKQLLTKFTSCLAHMTIGVLVGIDMFPISPKV